MEKIGQEIQYNGSIWLKYDVKGPTDIESTMTQVNVMFPDESTNWTWDYNLLKASKIITIDDTKYTIVGFCHFCYDGVMKKGSTISVLPYLG